MAKLEDLFSASLKQPRKLLDLSKVKIDNDADFFKYMDKVPELKLRQEKVDPEEVQIISDFTFTSGSHNASGGKSKRYQYEDPLPLSMRSTRLDDLWALDIHWKMLTSDRPPNRLEEGIFERLVELGRLSLAARKQEQVTIKAIMSSIIGTPAVTYLFALGFITSRSKRGAMETCLKICKHCGMELCSGAFCKVFHYEGFTRMIMDKEELENQEKEEIAFLKSVSRSVADQGASSNAKSNSDKKAGGTSSKQGRRLKFQIKRAKKKKKKKKAKQDNLDPVLAPDE